MECPGRIFWDKEEDEEGSPYIVTVGFCRTGARHYIVSHKPFLMKSNREEEEVHPDLSNGFQEERGETLHNHHKNSFLLEMRADGRIITDRLGCVLRRGEEANSAMI
jgi:hypothetical protein